MADTWFQFFQTAQSIVMALATVLMWFWGRQQKAERGLLEGRFQRIIERQIEHEEDFNRRVEHINDQLSSKLVPSVQNLMGRMDRMPEDLRQKFLSLDRAVDIIDESRRDRASLWLEFQKYERRKTPR